ncbi:MAG: DNA cytosine methyltransferase [Acutalibacteraceae bacterium]
MVALERAGIPVERYVAYEIDKYAIKVSKKNYPQIEQMGDVTTADFTQYKGFDLLIGGSPCTYWSIAKKSREITPDGVGGQLFMHFVRALRESRCKYFLYENNYSIHKNIKAFISEQLGVQPIMINSALVSAQQRKRCYWTNIPDIGQPEDKGILLNDILESGVAWLEKSYAYTTRCQAAIFKDTLVRHRHTMVAEPVIYQRSHGFNQGSIKKRDKMPTITATGSYIHNNYIIEPVRIGQYGNGGQGQRIYSPYGKSVSLSANGGGQGAKTGLYLAPVNITSKLRCGVYEVKNGYVNCNGNLYPINLPDGYYVVRKLTPVEAERLQTLPDNYTEGVSNTQRYKCIGNGCPITVTGEIYKPKGVK